MSKPKTIKYKAVYVTDLKSTVYELSKLSPEVYSSIVAAFDRYLNHFSCSVSLSISPLELAKELIYWNVHDVSYGVLSSKCTMFHFNPFLANMLF